jgi:meso-butanediol dehydrogenase / (S,S)-butanediol dehydrogenase / diacetyl reductase
MKTAVVTGAASGIGRAVALHLARDGYGVALVDVDAAGMKETLRSIESASGVAQAFESDVCDAHQLGVTVREVLASMGSPDLLVNVAGVGVAATVLDTSDQDWNRVIGTNLTGPFLLTRAILPLMLDAGSGVIVNVASVAGVVGLAARAAYCASKAGLIGLTRAVAADYASLGVRCVAVCPGTVETEWIDRIIAGESDPAATRKRMAARQLDGRMGTPEEIAATIAFIASPAGRFFNGAAVVVDGGMTAV